MLLLLVFFAYLLAELTNEDECTNVAYLLTHLKIIQLSRNFITLSGDAF